MHPFACAQAVLSAIGNASQLILGGVAKGRQISVKSAQLLNSVSGIVALGASEQAADMLGDLKVRAGILHAG
jgi:hypothetical protein